MNTTEPDFMEWVEVDFDGWHLKENAPKKVKIPELEQKIQNLNNEMNFVSDYETIHSLSLKRDLLEQELEEFTS